MYNFAKLVLKIDEKKEALKNYYQIVVEAIGSRITNYCGSGCCTVQLRV